MKYLIKMENIVTAFGDNIIHNGVSLKVGEGEIFGVLGESGAGKSLLVKEMLKLIEPKSGKIEVLGHDLNQISYRSLQNLKREWGVLFQFGALFTSLSVGENIAMPLKEYTKASEDLIEKIVNHKLDIVGLPKKAKYLYPSELSGGMIKRASLARALAMDPKLLFLDEPTSGLDPIGARAFDELILNLKDALGVTVVMITHDLDSIFTIIDKMAILADKKVVAHGSLEEILKSKHPFVERFFKNDYLKHRMDRFSLIGD